MSEATLAKIAVTGSADEALSKALELVNHNFDGGRVTKIDLASWLLHRIAEQMNETMIDEIRKAYFNQVVYLEALVKKMKASGRDGLSKDEMTVLQSLMGVENPRKKMRPGKSQSLPQEESHLVK